jgi:hypothetical protein
LPVLPSASDPCAGAGLAYGTYCAADPLIIAVCPGEFPCGTNLIIWSEMRSLRGVVVDGCPGCCGRGLIDLSECGLGYLEGINEIVDGRCHHPFDGVGSIEVTIQEVP